MPDRLVNVERQGAEVLHTDTLASRPAREEPEANLDQVIRDRAYLLWEQAGRPDAGADEFWHESAASDILRRRRRDVEAGRRSGRQGGRALA